MTAVKTTMAGGGIGSRIAYRVASTAIRLTLLVYNRARVEGREHLPTSGAYVLAPVHRSNYDTPVASMVTRRRLRFMGKDTLWSSRPFGWLLSAFGGFPVTRGSADREALRRCVEVLIGGEPLVLFPEGERKSGPEVAPLFDGAAYVAARAGVPIVPVGIGGTERVMPVGASMVRPHRVHVIIGAPIIVPGAGTRTARSALRETTVELRETLQRLFDEAQRRAGAQAPDK